jgi:hypothetical protein
MWERLGTQWPYMFLSVFLGTAVEQYDFLLYRTPVAFCLQKSVFTQSRSAGWHFRVGQHIRGRRSCCAR